MNEWITNNSLSGYLYVLRTNQSLPDSLEPPESRPWVGPEEALNRGQCFQRVQTASSICAHPWAVCQAWRTPVLCGMAAPASPSVGGLWIPVPGVREPAAKPGLLRTRQQTRHPQLQDSEDRSWAEKAECECFDDKVQSYSTALSWRSCRALRELHPPGCSINESLLLPGGQWEEQIEGLHWKPALGEVTWSYEWCLWSELVPRLWAPST